MSSRPCSVASDHDSRSADQPREDASFSTWDPTVGFIRGLAYLKKEASREPAMH
jgi:hypothetical protein